MLAIVSTGRTVVPVPRRPARVPGLKERFILRMASGLNYLCGSRGRDCFGILMYHRVTDFPAGFPEPTWNVEPERFEEQLAGLLARGFEPWPLSRAIEFHQDARPIPRRAFIVTFDDGYECVYRRAWPILRKLQVPATIFLATAYLDSNEPFPCDDWLAAGDAKVSPDSWQPLTTTQCREMHQGGLIELAAHTHTHDDFRGRPDDLRRDLLQNLHELRERFGINAATFAFPFGIVKEGFAGKPLSDVARDVGLLCSLSTEPELVHRSSDPFSWGRFPAEQHDTASSLAASLGGWTGALREIKRALKNGFCKKP